MRKIALVGQPNVGKSLLMQRLTGVSAFVSNYPGTTVEITGGKLTGTTQVDIVDTPGTYSLRSGSSEQRVTAKVLREGDFDLIINVVDATNLARNLNLTIELLDYGIPMVVALNQYDRLSASGIRIDVKRLEGLLGVPVYPVSAFSRSGVPALVGILRGAVDRPKHLDTGDAEIPCVENGTMARYRLTASIAEQCIRSVRRSRHTPMLDRLPGVTVVLLGAITLLAGYAVQASIRASEHLAWVLLKPTEAWLYGLITRVYRGTHARFVVGAVTEGLVVPFGTVMPSMLCVFLLIALLEDSGLLSRFAAALNGITSGIGLPGQGAIPLVLGLGCRTPGVVSTRLLPTLRERIIAIALLCLVVPCAATVGVVAGVIAHFGASAAIVFGTVIVVLVFLGRLLHSLLPGARSPLMIEVPPLRLPAIENVLTKTWLRMEGFFRHVLPMLVALNVLVRFLITYGVLTVPSSWSTISTRLLGVRAEVLAGVLTTAIQRYLAPIVLLNLPLSPREATIACVMVCLSFPCAPCTAVTANEIGVLRTVIIFCVGAILPLIAAITLNLVL